MCLVAASRLKVTCEPAETHFSTPTAVWLKTFQPAAAHTHNQTLWFEMETFLSVTDVLFTFTAVSSTGSNWTAKLQRFADTLLFFPFSSFHIVLAVNAAIFTLSDSKYLFPFQDSGPYFPAGTNPAAAQLQSAEFPLVEGGVVQLRLLEQLRWCRDILLVKVAWNPDVLLTYINIWDVWSLLYFSYTPGPDSSWSTWSVCCF